MEHKQEELLGNRAGCEGYIQNSQVLQGVHPEMEIQIEKSQYNGISTDLLCKSTKKGLTGSYLKVMTFDLSLEGRIRMRLIGKKGEKGTPGRSNVSKYTEE